MSRWAPIFALVACGSAMALTRPQPRVSVARRAATLKGLPAPAVEYRCDACGVDPIVGPRHTSGDVDVCGACAASPELLAPELATLDYAVVDEWD